MKYVILTGNFPTPSGEIPKGTILPVYEEKENGAYITYAFHNFWVNSHYYKPWEADKEAPSTLDDFANVPSIEERLSKIETTFDFLKQDPFFALAFKEKIDNLESRQNTIDEWMGDIKDKVHELELAEEYADERIKGLLSQVKILPEMISEQLGDMAARIKVAEEQLLEMQTEEVRGNTPARPKHRENTLCTYTTTGDPIYEGDILGFANRCTSVVLYVPMEARFVAVEFTPHRQSVVHSVMQRTTRWEILGNVDDKPELLPHMPKNTNLAKLFEQ